ncbi:hypothetical protein PC112_g149 [Phytophthora cactorum]|nr:hypothetical protein PC112_g149 [Phytophthora cactorum]
MNTLTDSVTEYKALAEASAKSLAELAAQPEPARPASPLPEAEAGILGKATKGLGTKVDLNYPAVLGHTNAEILKKTYYKMYGHNLGSVLDSDLHTDNKKAILA